MTDRTDRQDDAREGRKAPPMSNYENEVFDATVGDYIRRTLTADGDDLGARLEAVAPALEAKEVTVEVAVTVHGADGDATFKRRTSSFVWRSEQELAALEAEIEAEEADA